MNDIVMILRRFDYGTKETLSWLYVMDKKDTLGVFACLEKPDLNNQRNVSCIPAGRYLCTRRNPTQKFNYEHLSGSWMSWRANQAAIRVIEHLRKPMRKALRRSS